LLANASKVFTPAFTNASAILGPIPSTLVKSSPLVTAFLALVAFLAPPVALIASI